MQNFHLGHHIDLIPTQRSSAIKAARGEGDRSLTQRADFWIKPVPAFLLRLSILNRSM